MTVTTNNASYYSVSMKGKFAQPSKSQNVMNIIVNYVQLTLRK